MTRGRNISTGGGGGSGGKTTGSTSSMIARVIKSIADLRHIGGASGRDLQVRFGSVPVRCRCAARSFRRWHQIGLKKLFQKTLCNNAATYRSSVDLNTFAVS
ncbi:unnamed protein product [Sphagnum jensenii]|uniref:Uncharacterized protein n=1 Tax=Sphagnum jensenii TaxID=128206 RepID=A0ABP1BGW8_9BRYO